MAKAHQDVIECCATGKQGSFSFITTMVQKYANTVSGLKMDNKKQPSSSEALKRADRL